MMKDPKTFAKQMLDLFYGDHDAAMAELFNAARTYPNIPTSYFQKVHTLILEDKLRSKDGTSKKVSENFWNEYLDVINR